jgi:hypothetical protein
MDELFNQCSHGKNYMPYCMFIQMGWPPNILEKPNGKGKCEAKLYGQVLIITAWLMQESNAVL